MKDLIKTIRTKLNLNQEQLASLMGVSPVTVNLSVTSQYSPNYALQFSPSKALKKQPKLLF